QAHPGAHPLSLHDALPICWLHADVQDLVAALLQDLSFEMDARLSLLRQSRGVDQGRLAEGALLRDQQLRDRLQRLASEAATLARSEEHTSELQSRENLVCR